MGLALANKGYQVFLGARDLAQAQHAAEFNNATQFGTNQQAASFGDIVYYTPRVHPQEVLEDVTVLDGKTVIESGNWDISKEFDFEESMLSKTQILQQQLPKAKIVKAFNTIIQEVFEYVPLDLKAHNIACFIASDHADAKQEVASLATALGFTAVDCGLAKQAILLEQAANLIRLLALFRKNKFLSFSLIELPEIKDLQFGGRTPSVLHKLMDFSKKNS